MGLGFRLGVAALAGAVLASVTAAGNAAQAAPQVCAALGKLYPQPGRAGLAGPNAYRPMPVFSPQRQSPGSAGTLGLTIMADHVSTNTAAENAPHAVYVGNYLVSDIPVFKLAGSPGNPAELVDPETGAQHAIPNECLASEDWAYSGTQWALTQGDTLDAMLYSRLDYQGPDATQRPVNGAVPCDSINLHTHGLLVSAYHPASAGHGTYGDYVLDVTEPPAANIFGATTDTCGAQLGTTTHRGHGITTLPLHYVTQIPGTPGVNSLASGEHPSGLFWYHPHPHGYSQPQVSGGTTGAITVGALTDYACPDGDGTPGNCTLTDANLRVMMLKDTQIQPNGTGGWTTIHSSDSGFCAVTGGERHGECESMHAKTPGKLIVTVNGIQYPLLHAAAGHMEIWRIINASATMSYGLTITPQGGGASLPFQLLATDGVTIKPHQGPDKHTYLLIMPASRVEIAIPAPPQGGTYVLNDVGPQTGQGGSGDIWPNIELARLVFDKQAAPAPAATPARAVQLAAPTLPHGADIHAMVQQNQTGLRPGCQFAAGDTRVIYFVHRFETVFGDAGGDPSHTPPSGLRPNLHELFGLIAGVRHSDGRMDFFGDDGKILHDIGAVWFAGLASGDVDFPAFGHNNWGTICTVQGNVEPWELQNWTGEVHNFHLHQTRFTLDLSGHFQFPDPKLEPTEDPGLRLTDAAVQDFLAPDTATAYHDTVPVPRGQSLCRANPNAPGCGGLPLECTGTPGGPVCARPGILSVLVDFSRAQQVGTFVYHCHILEHEDGGMMSLIKVLCPPGDAACAAQQINERICRPLEAALR